MKKLVANIEWSGDNFAGYIHDKSLGTLLFAFENVEKMNETIKDTLDFHVEGMRKDGDAIPQWYINHEYVVKPMLEMSAVLHLYDGIIPLKSLSKLSGVDVKRLRVYASGKSKPQKQTVAMIKSGIKTIAKKCSELAMLSL